MGGWGHGDWAFQGVQPIFAAAVENGGEALFSPFAGDGGEVQPHLLAALLLHGVDQGAADLIPWGEIPAAQISDGALTMGIQQHAPFAAHGFRDQKTRCSFQL